MKTILLSLIQITVASLCLTVTSSSHAQGNLFVNANWTAQDLSNNSVYINIQPNGYFLTSFSYGGGSISQTISTTPGINYDLSFRADQYYGISASSVSINSDLLDHFAPDDPFNSPLNTDSVLPNNIYYNFDFSFTALSANTTISFTEIPEAYLGYLGSGLYWSASGLDSISVMAAPEPSSLALLGVGLVSLFACHRQKRLTK